MATDRERRLSLVEQTPLPLGAALTPEQEEFLAALTVNALKWLNRQHHRPDVQADEALCREVTLEAARLSDLDRRGLLTGYWWQEYDGEGPGHGVAPSWSRVAGSSSRSTISTRTFATTRRTRPTRCKPSGS